MITVDGYSDLERIGHGGLGDVYRATRDSTGSTFAIKVLRDVSDASVAWHRTRRELTALVSLAGHAHVVQLVELLDLPEGPALVMEYAPGGSVADLVARCASTLTVGEAVLIGRHTADALVAAHEQEIVHRDIKPQNLLIDGYGRIKLCDFGIASLARSDDFRTRTNALSLRYASPEDLDEDAEVGPASDVYSLGATLLHLVHGAPLTMKDRLQPWTAPATDDQELATLDRVIELCLQPDPDGRPSSPDLLDQLEAIDWKLTDRCRALPVETPTSFAGERGDDAGDGSAGRHVEHHRSPPPAAGVAPRDLSPFGDDRPVRPPTACDPGAAPGVSDDTSSTTARRSDAVVPPRRPVPTAEPARRWPWVIGAICIAATAGAGAALLWPAAHGDDVGADGQGAVLAGELADGTVETPTPTEPTTDDATDTATHDATDAVTNDATDAATDDATDAATDDATDDVTDDATGTATDDATDAATDDATDAVTDDATDTATEPDVAAVSVVARPEGLPALDDTSITWPFGDVGECLVQVSGLAELMPVDCAEPHDLQRFAVGELDEIDVTGQGRVLDVVRSITDDACREAFAEFVGVDEPDSVFLIAVTRPSDDSWAEGDRRYQCLLGVPDHHVSGDAESGGGDSAQQVEPASGSMGGGPLAPLAAFDERVSASTDGALGPHRLLDPRPRRHGGGVHRSNGGASRVRRLAPRDGDEERPGRVGQLLPRADRTGPGSTRARRSSSPRRG